MSILKKIMRPNKKQIAKERKITRHCAARVMKAYKKGEPINKRDAVECAFAATVFMNLIEEANPQKGEAGDEV